MPSQPEKPALIEVMLQERQEEIINVIGWLQSETAPKNLVSNALFDCF